VEHTIAHRVGRFLERQGLLERDAENGYLADNAVQAGSLDQLLGHAITYRIAVGPHKGSKVFSLQTLPACDEPFDDSVGKVVLPEYSYSLISVTKFSSTVNLNSPTFFSVDEDLGA
jgi:hypothetical protein